MKNAKLSLSLWSLLIGVILIIIASILSWFTDHLAVFVLFTVGSILLFSVGIALLGAALLNLISKE